MLADSKGSRVYELPKGTRITAYINDIAVALNKRCIIGRTRKDRLPGYVRGLLDTIRSAHDGDNTSSAAVPLIHTKWSYFDLEEHMVLNEIDFTTVIDYNEASHEPAPDIVIMMDKERVVVRKGVVADLYNMITHIQCGTNKSSTYFQPLGNALLARIEGLFITEEPAGARYPMSTIVNYTHLPPSRYLRFVHDAKYRIDRAEDEDEKEEQDATKNEDGGARPAAQAIVISREKARKSKSDDAFYYGQYGTPYFLYVDILRDNTLLEKIMALYTENITSYTHRLVITSIREYVKKVLFGRRINQKIDTRRQKGIFVTQPGYNTTWETKISAYQKREEAIQPGTRLMLGTTPFISHLTDESKISIVAISRETTDENDEHEDEEEEEEEDDDDDRDDDEHKILEGYVTCDLVSVSAIPALDATLTKSMLRETIVDLHHFVETFESRRGNDLYNVYHLNGLHLAHHRRGNGIARILVYYALRFATMSHKELGIRIVTCDAVSYATSTLLESFGFSCYGESTSLYWVIGALRELITTIREPTKTQLFDPPPSLETFMFHVDRHIRKYNGPENPLEARYDELAILVAQLYSAELQINELLAINIKLNKIKVTLDSSNSTGVQSYIEQLIKGHPITGMSCFLALDRTNKVFDKEMSRMAELVATHGGESPARQGKKRSADFLHFFSHHAIDRFTQ